MRVLLASAFFILYLGSAAALSRAGASTIEPGDLVVYRVGDGTGALMNGGNAVFVDEYTPSGTLVQSIAMPTVASGSNNPLVASGTATSEGMLTLSADGKYVMLTGYDRAVGATSNIANTTSAAVPRDVGIVSVATGAVDTTTALSDFSSANNPRGVASTNGTDIWVTGGAGGIRYTTTGGTSSIQLSTTTANIRGTSIYDGQLYESGNNGSVVHLGTVGTLTPTTSGQTITQLPGVPVTGTSPYAFLLEDLNPSVPGVDTLYIAEDTTGGGQIQKYSLVSDTWTANGTVAASAIRGLTGSVDGSGNVDLYGSTGAGTATGGGSLYSFVDSTGYNGAISGTATTFVTLSGTSNEAFRGIAIVPVPEPSSLALLAAVALGLVGIRLQRRLFGQDFVAKRI